MVFPILPFSYIVSFSRKLEKKEEQEEGPKGAAEGKYIDHGGREIIPVGGKKLVGQ